jgi:GMP synthase (glutamine-hydrolysing) A subunit
MHQKILILDFGSQVTQLIARRIREAHVFCEVHPCDVSDEWIRDYAKDGLLKGIVLSGSHASTYEEHDLRAPKVVYELGIPVLGICYGMFTMAVQLGGVVAPSDKREFGHADVRAHGHTALLDGIQDYATPMGHGMLKVWMSHGDKVTELPPGFSLMASTDSCPIAGMADDQRLAAQTGNRVEADDLSQGERKHPVGEALGQILGRGEGQTGEVGQGAEAGLANQLAVAADVALEADQHGLQALELQLLQLGPRHQFITAVKNIHSQTSL